MHRRDVLAVAGLAVCGSTATALGAARSPRASQRAGEESPSFAPLGSVDLPGAREAVIGAGGETVFVATEDGFAVVDVGNPSDPRVVTRRRDLLADRDGGPLRDVQEVAVEGDRLLVVGPAHDRRDTIRAAVLFDVSRPEEPRQRGVYEAAEPIHNAALEGGLAYLTGTDGFGNPLVIVDLLDDQGVLGQWSILDYDPAWAGVDPSLRPIHDVIVREDRAFCSLWDAGTWIVDVSDPGAPSAVGRVGGRPRRDLAALDGDAVRRAGLERPGNHHSAAISTDGTLLAVGKEAWDAPGGTVGGPAGIDLWDVSNPAHPRRRGTVRPPTTPDPSYGGTWTTAHNFALRDGRLYSSWYQGGIRIHDVRDPSTPRELAAWSDPTTTRFWTAVPGDDTVVAASMGIDDHPAGVYTFPIELAGATGSPSTGRSGESTRPDSPGPGSGNQGTGPEGSGSAIDTASGPRPRTATPPPNPEATTGAGERTATAEQPGFGVGLGLLGALLGVATLRYRWGGERNDRR